MNLPHSFYCCQLEKDLAICSPHFTVEELIWRSLSHSRGRAGLSCQHFAPSGSLIYFQECSGSYSITLHYSTEHIYKWDQEQEKEHLLSSFIFFDKVSEGWPMATENSFKNINVLHLYLNISTNVFSYPDPELNLLSSNIIYAYFHSKVPSLISPPPNLCKEEAPCTDSQGLCASYL